MTCVAASDNLHERIHHDGKSDGCTNQRDRPTGRWCIRNSCNGDAASLYSAIIGWVTPVHKRLTAVLIIHFAVGPIQDLQGVGHRHSEFAVCESKGMSMHHYHSCPYAHYEGLGKFVENE